MITFAQVKEIYMLEDLTEVSKEKFDSLKSNKTFVMSFDFDTMMAYAIIEWQTLGKLSDDINEAIRAEISTLSNTNIPPENAIIINYYHRKDSCNSSGDGNIMKKRVYHYLKKVSKIENVSQFHFYKSAEGIEKYGKINWFSDANQVIEKMFLPLPYPCNSFVILFPSGNYIAQKGEHSYDYIFKLLKEEKALFTVD